MELTGNIFLPPLKSDNHFLETRLIFEHLWKKWIFPLENPKTLEKFQKIGVGHAKCHAHCSKCWSNHANWRPDQNDGPCQGPRGRTPLPLNLKKNSKNWCWTCKMPGTLIKMLAIPHKMIATPCKMSAAPRIMSAATHLMLPRTKGELEVPQGARLPQHFCV